MKAKRRGKPVARGVRGAGGAKRSYRSAWAAARDPKQSVKNRVAALAGLSQAVCDDDAMLQGALKILRDTAEPIAVRLAVLQAMQAASFSARRFAACRPAYLAALRSVVADPDTELRQRALGLLAREHDSYAQQRLIEGLKKPAKALVPPEKALQLLSYDIHADAYPLAREIARKPPNPAAKREALRLLAADARSVPAFEKILRNKNEVPEIRQLAASALHSLAPGKLQARARAIVLDRSEDDEIKATSLTALTHFGDAEAVAKDVTLQKQVDRLKGTAGSGELKRAARRFDSKYRR